MTEEILQGQVEEEGDFITRTLNAIPMPAHERAVKEQLWRTMEFQDQILRTKGKEDLYIFNKWVLDVEQGKEALAPFHKELCHFVQDNTKKKKLILIPRGHLKSTLITIGYSVFRIINNPNIRILILNATWQMAVDFLTEIKNHLTKTERLQELFAEEGKPWLAENPTEWSQDRITLQRTNQNIKGPTVWAAGIESNLVGSHPDLIIFDDVQVRENTQSREQIEKVILRYKDALDLLEPGGQLIVIGTRWVEGDFYSWLMDKDNEIHRSYDVMVKTAYEGNMTTGEEFKALWPEKFTQKELSDRLREKGSYEFCTPFETPILMSDFTTKPIGKIKEGDEVIGFNSRKSGRRELCKTKVKKVTRINQAPVYKLEMASGRTVLSTKEHKWYTGRSETDKTHKIYVPAKVGRSLFFVCPVEEKELSKKEIADWNYLAGMFDGEGSAKSGGCLTITQGHIKNKIVYDKIITTLKDLKIEHGEYERKVINPKWGDSKIIWLKDNFVTQLNLIRNTQLAKKQQIADKMLKVGSRFVREKDKVISIDYWKEAPVYALETETGNYVAWGYASSNSAQYMNNPIPEDEALFKKSQFKSFNFFDIRGKEMTKVMTIDPAISEKKTADYTAIVVTGIDTFGNIFVLDIVRKRMGPSEIIETIFDLQSQWHVQQIGIETIAYQKALAYSLREEVQKRKRYLPITEIKSHEMSKDQRIKGLQPSYQGGNVWHRDKKELPNIVYLEDELLAFPRSQHDDIADALSMQLDMWYPPKPKKSRYQQQYLY